MGFPGSSAGKKKNPSVVQETLVQSLGWEDPLEEGMATHSSILAWRLPMDRRAWRAAAYGVAESRTRLSAAQWFGGRVVAVLTLGGK